MTIEDLIECSQSTGIL